MSKSARFGIRLLAAMLVAALAVHAAPRKAHVVVLGATRQVAYSKAGDPAGAAAGETELRIRALLVDGVLKEWTTGEAHDVTDRSFRRCQRARTRDAAKSDRRHAGDQSSAQRQPATADKSTVGSSRHAPSPVRQAAGGYWVWQRGPWLLVDRVTGHVVALKLPDYKPGVSQVSWFRDYGAYCGVTASGKSLYAVVAQVAARKPVLAKKLSAYDAENHPEPVCGLAEWQREPLRVTFHPTGKDAASFDVVPGSAVLVEDGAESRE